MADKPIDVTMERIKSIIYIIMSFLAILIAVNYLINRIMEFIGTEGIPGFNVLYILMSVTMGIGIIYSSYLYLYGKLVSRSTHNRLVNKYKDRFGGVLLIFLRRGRS